MALAQSPPVTLPAAKMAARRSRSSTTTAPTLRPISSVIVDSNGIGPPRPRSRPAAAFFLPVSEDETVALATLNRLPRDVNVVGNEAASRSRRAPPGRAVPSKNRDPCPDDARRRGALRGSRAVPRASPSTRPPPRGVLIPPSTARRRLVRCAGEPAPAHRHRLRANLGRSSDLSSPCWKWGG